MAITTGDGLMAALATAQSYSWFKYSPANIVTPMQYSLWLPNGSPVSGSTPTVATTCTSVTTGAIPFVNPGGGQLTYIGYLASLSSNTTSGVGIIMYDRLSHMGGLSGTVITAQTVNLTIPASRGIFADDTNAEWYVECYADLGSTSRTLTVTYVNTASATNTVAITIPSTLRSGEMLRVSPSVSGDVIQSITSCILSASTGTAGNFGLTCARRIAHASVTSPEVVDLQDPVYSGMAQVPDNACLWLTAMSGLSAAYNISGYLKLLQG